VIDFYIKILVNREKVVGLFIQVTLFILSFILQTMPLNYVNICIALYDYTAHTDDELTFHEDDVLYILENDDEDWWKAKLKSTNTEGEGSENSEEHSIGLVPRNYIQEVCFLICSIDFRSLFNFVLIYILYLRATIQN